MPDEGRAPALLVVSLGRRGYGEALELQRAVARARISGEIADDVLLLVEHPPVVTLGRSSKDAHLVASPQLLAARGVELFEVERGGDVTFHGPGQLVGYPIVDLKRHRKDLHWYLRQVEEALGEIGVLGSERILDPALRHILVERFVERMRGDAHRIVLDGEQRLRLQPARHQIGTGGGQHGGGQQNGSDIRTVH